MTQSLLEPVQQILDDIKAIDVETIDVRELTPITDWMVICCGTSNRHVKAIANRLTLDVKAAGFQPLGVEGEEEAEWILVDLNDVVVHIMLPEAREHYSLEKLWAKIPRDEPRH